MKLSLLVALLFIIVLPGCGAQAEEVAAEGDEENL